MDDLTLLKLNRRFYNYCERKGVNPGICGFGFDKTLNNKFSFIYLHNQTDSEMIYTHLDLTNPLFISEAWMSSGEAQKLFDLCLAMANNLDEKIVSKVKVLIGSKFFDNEMLKKFYDAGMIEDACLANTFTQSDYDFWLKVLDTVEITEEAIEEHKNLDVLHVVDLYPDLFPGFDKEEFIKFHY